MTHSEPYGTEGPGGDPARDVVGRLARRVKCLERANRRWGLINAALLAATAVLGAGGVPRMTAVRAQQVERKERALPAAEPQAEAQVSLALKALQSIDHRVNSGVGVLGRDHVTALWSRRLLYAQLLLANDATPRVTLFEAHRARMIEVEARANRQYRERRISDLEQMELEYFERESGLWLERVKAGRPPWVVWTGY
jgi:hypothetical protein